MKYNIPTILKTLCIFAEKLRMEHIDRIAKRISFHCLFFATLLFSACQGHAVIEKESDGFVRVADGHFELDGTRYTFVGCNLWYGAILGSTGEGGDRERLCRELDSLCCLGVKNLRVLVGAEGISNRNDHIRPVLQPRPGVYNDTLLAGLDFLMQELGRRGMKAVLYLHNAWQWSGGFGCYLEWAGAGEAAPPDNWEDYCTYHSQFVRNDNARALALQHTRFIVSRKNRLTGLRYTDDPALMAWEICNEPRPFARDSSTKQAFADWIAEQAHAIKSIDHRHLVTTGSEGFYGCETDMELYEQIHALADIDYLCLHIWPYTWNWMGVFASPSSAAKVANAPNTVTDSLPVACQRTQEYIALHTAVAQRLGKPLVIEEFGYPRDGFDIATTSPTTARDRYYNYVLEQIGHNVDGCNFWAWGGLAKVRHPFWQRGDDYTGDPAQEEQGLYSVFTSDGTTLAIVKKHVSLQID